MTSALKEMASGVLSLADVFGLRRLPTVYDVPPEHALEIDFLLLVGDARLVSSELAATLDQALPEQELIHA